MVAGKLDPTIGQICFHRIFQTVMNLEKRTTKMSFEGPIMVGGSNKIRRPKVADAALFASPIRARPTAAGREISR